VNILLDENISPKLAPRLADKGVSAAYVAHVGLSGVTDAEVWNYAYKHDQIVVTINAADFMKLASEVELHPGLIVMRSQGLSPNGQWQWLEPVIDSLQAGTGNLVNQVVEITGQGAFKTRPLPITKDGC
jgi:predicted nuclease of predicted toxin-antitoxin system